MPARRFPPAPGLGTVGAVRLGLGKLPQGVGSGQVVGGAALSGIGFTVSLLIVGLAFEAPALRAQATVGVLLAAVLSVGTGWLVFRLAAVLRGERTAGLPMVLDRPVDAAYDHIRGPVEAAGAQGHFWEMHDLLFASQDELEPEDLIGYAADLGLDVEQFVRDPNDERLAARIREDITSAEASGARGTPTFFLGTRRHVGPFDTESLTRELEAARAADRAADRATDRGSSPAD